MIRDIGFANTKLFITDIEREWRKDSKSYEKSIYWNDKNFGLFSNGSKNINQNLFDSCINKIYYPQSILETKKMVKSIALSKQCFRHY